MLTRLSGGYSPHNPYVIIVSHDKAEVKTGIQVFLKRGSGRLETLYLQRLYGIMLAKRL